MSKLFFIPLLSMLFINPGPGKDKCSCGYNGPFLEMASATPLVAFIKVTKHLTFKDIYGKSIPMSMEVEVIEKYKGAEERRSFTVWGDPGNLCRPYLSHFDEGGYYVIAFSAAGRGKDETTTDYTISICGCYWLQADHEKQTATGDITSGEPTAKQTMDLSKIKTALQEK